MSFCRYDDNDTEGGFHWGGTPDDDDDGCSLLPFPPSTPTAVTASVSVLLAVSVSVSAFMFYVYVPVSGMMTTMMLMGQWRQRELLARLMAATFRNSGNRECLAQDTGHFLTPESLVTGPNRRLKLKRFPTRYGDCHWKKNVLNISTVIEIHLDDGWPFLGKWDLIQFLVKINISFGIPKISFFTVKRPGEKDENLKLNSGTRLTVTLIKLLIFASRQLPPALPTFFLPYFLHPTYKKPSRTCCAGLF